MKTLCQLEEGGVEEEAMFEPIILVGLRLDGGSRMTKGTTIEVGGEPKGASVGRSVNS